MYSVVVIDLPVFAVWLVVGLVVEAIAIGILAYLVLRTACTVTIVQLVQANHERDIDELWTIHEAKLESKEEVKTDE